jgi:chromosomal replication initiator protein
MEKVSEVRDIPVELIKSDRRFEERALARHMFCYLAKKITAFSLSRIGKEIGGRDHSTVLASLKKCEALMFTEKDFNKDCLSILAYFQNESI